MMADRKQPIETASRKCGSDKTRRFPHLKPLSDYTRMVLAEATNTCSVSPSCNPDSPAWNLQVELRSSRACVGRKRRLDDSCLDQTYYNTPLKKPCLAERPSPDSACVVDSLDTFRQVRLVSTQSSVVLDKIKRVEKILSDQKSLGLGWIDGQSSMSLSDVRSSSPVVAHNEDGVDNFAFDYDVDEIMCPNPTDCADVSADGLEDFIQSCQTCEEQLSVKEGGSSRQKQGSGECLLGKDAQTRSNEGYVTKSRYTADPAESKVTAESAVIKGDNVCFIKSSKITVPNDKTPPMNIPIMSTPLKKFRKRCPILSPKLDLEKESWSTPSVICQPVKTSSASSQSVQVNLDASNTEMRPTIPFLNENKEVNLVHEGTSIHKSSVCRDQGKQAANQVMEDEDLLSVSQQQPDSQIQVTFEEETDATDSFESTLPLQVQVKSKVVLPNKQQSEAAKTTAHHQPEKNVASEGRRNVYKHMPRPVVLFREEDWEKEKKVYVDSVTRHMTDNTDDGVMTELLHLMNAVADQEKGSEGRKWQHPSDLTRRNYRLRNSSRLLSLDEWQNLNYRNHFRFAEVPKIFKRSPVL